MFVQICPQLYRSKMERRWAGSCFKFAKNVWRLTGTIEYSRV